MKIFILITSLLVSNLALAEAYDQELIEEMEYLENSYNDIDVYQAQEMNPETLNENEEQFLTTEVSNEEILDLNSKEYLDEVETNSAAIRRRSRFDTEAEKPEILEAQPEGPKTEITQ